MADRAGADATLGTNEGNDVADRIGLAVEFSSLAQWNEIRTQLLDTPGVEGLDVMTVSARNADVALSYPGGAQALANALGGRGLNLTDAGGAGWVLRSRN